MNVNYKQSQFELFPTAGDSATKVNRPLFLFSSVTLSLENIVVTSIIGVLILALSFSIGVERGKRIAASSRFSLPSAQSQTVSQFEEKNKTATSTVTRPVAAPKPVSPLIPQGGVVDLAKANSQKAAIVKNSSSTPQPVQALQAGGSPYTVQVASFASAEYARKEAASLGKKGFDNFIISKGKYVIVCVGKFSKKEEANVALSRLQKTYKDCMIRRL